MRQIVQYSGMPKALGHIDGAQIDCVCHVRIQQTVTFTTLEQMSMGVTAL